MTYEVQQTRWDRIVRRVTGSVGPGSRVSETISELMPVVDLERIPSELLLLGGTQIVFGQSLAPAVAATFPYVSVLNPVNSGNLLTITSAQLFSNTAGLLNISLTQNVLPVAGTQSIRDGRRGITGVPVGQALIDNNLVAGGLRSRLRILASIPFFWQDPNDLAVLSPGTALLISHTAANVTLEAQWMWRERPAEESELQF